MQNFVFHTPTKVYFGKDEELKVGKIIKEILEELDVLVIDGDIYNIDGKCTISQYENLYEKIYYWSKNNIGEDGVENENWNIDEAINTLKQVFIPISKEEYYSLATNV